MHPLPSRICGVTLALELVLACAHPVNAQKTLEGTWTATKAERDGKAADDVVGHRLSFASDRFQIRSKDAKSVYAGSFRVDASASPAAIDFDHSEGSLRGKAWKGIYALDGDTLIICDNAEDLEKARARRFRGKEWVRIYPRHVQARLSTSGPAGKLAATEIALQGEVISGNGLRLTSLSSTAFSLVNLPRPPL